MVSEHKNTENGNMYLVIGGEMENFVSQKFMDCEKMEFVGLFADYNAAQKAWKGRALETVDNALQRYCIIALNSALQPVSAV